MGGEPRVIPTAAIDGHRLLARLAQLGQVGRDADGRLVRLAASDADKCGRDLFGRWVREAGLELVVDRIGNMFGLLPGTESSPGSWVLVGSHLDTVVDAGIHDGTYGVLAGLEVLDALRRTDRVRERSLAVAAFTNEEGVRFTPDMLGSQVFAGALPLEAALGQADGDGTILGNELARIGYAGAAEPGWLDPVAYLELHIEQGPLLEHHDRTIGVVTGVQGLSWWEIAIDGVANHAGTTPTAMRRDAGLAAARLVSWLRDELATIDSPTRATVGCVRFEPAAINVVPSRAIVTVDLRHPEAEGLARAEGRFRQYLERLTTREGVTIASRCLARLEPVTFEARLLGMIEAAAAERGLSTLRLVSGAGHDAQVMAALCPSAMIFVPSLGGISHSPREASRPADLVSGANVLLDVVRRLVLGDDVGRTAR